MLFLNKKVKTVIFLITTALFAFTLSAKTYKWSNISQQQYVDNLVNCTIQLQEYKWSKTHKVTNSAEYKRSFKDFYPNKIMRQQVLENLQMQYILLDDFNTRITPEMLQYDIKRMANSTKDAKSLKEIFALFDNDANTIAQCISRPYLVTQKLHSNYDYNNTIHGATKARAQLQLKDYLDGRAIEDLSSHESTVAFVIQQEFLDKNKKTNDSDEFTISLSREEFELKQQQLLNNSLLEKGYGFIYSEIVEESESAFKVKTLTWLKNSFNLWIEQQKGEIFTYGFQNFIYTLPDIVASKQVYGIKAAIVGDSWASYGYIPSARGELSAIWTGSEMIVWGGGGLNSGGRYAPATDSWQPTNTGTNVPSGRSGHTAIWDDLNNKMIVWGGFDGARLNTGGRYDPITDSWQATSTGTNTPVARNDHVAVWDNVNNQMIIWGGYSGSSRLNTGGRYDSSMDSWLATSTGVNVPSSRTKQSVVWDEANSQMIVWGGFNGSRLNTGGRYDPSDDSWQTTSVDTNVPSGREGHSAIWDKTNNQMIIWGGYASGNTNTGGLYDSSNDSWEPTSIAANVPIGRNSHKAVWDDLNNQMIIWSGNVGATTTNTGGRYNPSTDSWLSTNTGSNVPSGRYYFDAVWSGSEMIVWGGYMNGGIPTNTGGRYDPNTDSWQATFIGADVPTARRWHTTVWDSANLQMIVWGGYDGSSRLFTGGRYDPITNSWLATSTGSNVPSSRAYHTAVWDNANNKMIIWGGEKSIGDYTNTGGRYNPLTDTWQITNIGTNVASARSNHTAIWDNDSNQMIVWGGYDGSSRLNTGGRYDPVVDSWQTTNISGDVPDIRSYHSAIWDDLNNQMIIWGGSGSISLVNTGGRYNPVLDSWQTVSIDNAPSGRVTHSVIWDNVNNQMIIWGGYDGAKTNTGGRYDPSADSWQATSIGTNVPSSRDSHSAIWDDVNNEMIIWGGIDTALTNTGGRYTPSTDSWKTTSINGQVPAGRSEHTAIWTGSEMLIWGGRDPTETNSLAIYYPYKDLMFTDGFE